MIESLTLYEHLICPTGGMIFGGKMNERFPGSTDHRLHLRLGSRTFSVSPNFALTARCDTLSDWVGHSDKVMPTQFSKVSHQGF